MKLFCFSSAYEDIIRYKMECFAIFVCYLHYMSINNNRDLSILDPNDLRSSYAFIVLLNLAVQST